jgi:hypothetical protein
LCDAQRALVLQLPVEARAATPEPAAGHPSSFVI